MVAAVGWFKSRDVMAIPAMQQLITPHGHLAVISRSRIDLPDLPLCRLDLYIDASP